MEEAFRRWLREKYGTAAALSGAWRRPVASFDDAAPPGPFCADTTGVQRGGVRDKEDLPALLDWLEFSEAAAPPDRRPGVLDYLPPEATESHGLRPLYERVRVAARQRRPAGQPPSVADVCGRAGLEAGSVAGDFAVRAALMHGADPRELPPGVDTGALGPLLDTLAREPWEADRKVLILYPRVYAHLKRLTSEPPAGVADDERTFGFERPIQVEGPALLKKFIDLTVRARFPFAVADTRIAPDALAAFPLAVCPTLEVLSADAMRTLEAYVTGGGFLAVGPRIPLLDETMRSDDTLARHFGEGLSDLSLEVRHCGRGAFLTLPGYVSAATIEFLAFESGLAKGLVADSPAIDSAVHRAGALRLLFVANPAPWPLGTTFTDEPFRALRPVAAAGEDTPYRAETQHTVPAGTVCCWLVE